jgi:hypothetical protein
MNDRLDKLYHFEGHTRGLGLWDCLPRLRAGPLCHVFFKLTYKSDIIV